MTTPHKHQATINAWAAGAQIQWRMHDRAVWEAADHPAWSPNYQYRVKSPHHALIDAHEAGDLIEVESADGAYWAVVFEPKWRPCSTYRISPRSAELKPMIAAHKAGKQIQRKNANGWVDTVPTWSTMFEYRIKDKFSDLKKAFSEGKLIESFHTNLDQFCVNLRPTWDEGVEYRISPRQDELKPVIAAYLEGKQIEFNQRSHPGWCLCFGSPLWQASHDYRVKTRWQKELDAWRAGKKIECRRTDRVDTWDVQIPANLDYYLLNPQDNLEYRIFDEYRALKEAEARGEVIEQARNINGLWYAQTSPCTWADAVSHYRVSPRSQELRQIIDAWKAGKQIQTPLDDAATKWRDMDVTPMFDSGSRYRIKPKEHKHQAVIDAYEAGQTVQCKLHDGTWHDHMKAGRCDSPCFSEDWEYRIKQPHQEVRDAFAAGKAIQYRVTAACQWVDGKNPQWYSDWDYRVKPEPLKSRRYIYNRAGKQQVGICDPNTNHQVPASTFVRWIDDDWVETEV